VVVGKKGEVPIVISGHAEGQTINYIYEDRIDMTLKTTLLLTLSIAGFALGATGLFWGIGFPVGAILFGLFMISKMLEKETALFNAEQQQHIEASKSVANQSTNVRASQGNFQAGHAVSRV